MKKRILFFTLAICLILTVGTLIGCTGKCSVHEFTMAHCDWNEDGTASVTVACAVCGEKITEKADVKEEITAKPTCFHDGKKKLTAIVDIGGNTFNKFEKTLNVTKLTHEYGAAKYDWASDCSSCTATKKCSLCGDVVKETVKSTVGRRTEASCLRAGEVVYNAVFKDGQFIKQTKSVQTAKKEHVFTGAIIYKWNGDACTAERRCINCTNTKKETAKGKLIVIGEKTCTVDGKGEYHAEFKDKDFSEQVKTTVIPKSHDYDYENPEYTWASDRSECKVVVKCKHCESSDTENAVVTVNRKDADCVEDGYIKYVAKFENAKTQTVEEVLQSRGGHNYSEAVYIWKVGDSACTAEKTCSACQQTVSEDAIITRRTLKAATCEEDGEAQVTASFVKAGFVEQVKNEVVKRKGHNVGNVTYEWSADDSECIGKEYCAACKKLIEEKKAKRVKSEVTQEKTCTADGKRTITAEFEFSDGTKRTEGKIVDISASHEFGEVKYEYSWEGNVLVCTASKTCRDCGEVESETKNGTFTVKVENGKTYIRYTVMFDNEDFGEKTYEFEVK